MTALLDSATQEGCVPLGDTHSTSHDSNIWSHVLPYVAFLLVVQLRGTSLELPTPFGSLFEAVVPLGLIAFFATRADYPELSWRNLQFKWIPLDAMIGLLSGWMWILPYVFLPALRPDDLQGTIGPDSSTLAIFFRGLTLVVAVPLLEELFIRSFLLRFAATQDGRNSFRDVPLAWFSWRSFIVTVVIFTIAHAFWEWWVALPWIVITLLWFYLRKNFWSVVVVHAAANLALLLIVLFASNRILPTNGEPYVLWYFV